MGLKKKENIVKIENKILYLHAGKTGGTTIEKMLIEAFKIQPDIYPQCDIYTVDRGRYTQHNTLDQYDVSEFAFSFATIRNPYTKFLSAFVYNEVFWRGQLGITSMEELLERIPEINKKFPNNHFIPQNKYTHINGEFALDELIRLETFELDIKRVFGKIGLSGKNIPFVNKGRKEKPELSPRCKKLIEELYKDDFEFYNY